MAYRHSVLAIDDRPYKTPTLSCCRRSVIASTALPVALAIDDRLYCAAGQLLYYITAPLLLQPILISIYLCARDLFLYFFFSRRFISLLSSLLRCDTKFVSSLYIEGRIRAIEI